MQFAPPTRVMHAAARLTRFLLGQDSASSTMNVGCRVEVSPTIEMTRSLLVTLPD